MRNLIRIFAMSLMLVTYCFGQESVEDMTYLKNSRIIGGTIIESIPKKSIKIRSNDGNVHVFTMSDSAKIVKEPADNQGIESWYLYFALGYGKPFYASSLQGKLDQPDGRSMDLVGVYWPLRDDRTILGGSISANMDQYNQQSLYSFSVMHFFDRVIGNGIFIRGDAGIAMLLGETEYEGFGVGSLVGLGYSFPVSNETRITTNLQYGIRIIKGNVHGALSINVGILL